MYAHSGSVQVHDVQFDYYGRRIATCSSDRTIKASWDARLFHFLLGRVVNVTLQHGNNVLIMHCALRCST